MRERKRLLIAWLVASCGSDPTPPAPTPVAIDAAPAIAIDAAPPPDAALDSLDDRIREIDSRPAKDIRGQLVRGGALVELATRTLAASHFDCREQGQPDTTQLIDRNGGRLLQIRVRGSTKIALGKPIPAKQVDIEAYVTDAANKTTTIKPTKGTVTFHRRGSIVDIELDLDLGKHGKIAGRMVAGVDGILPRACILR